MAVTIGSDVFLPQSVGKLATDILFKRTPLLSSGYVADAKPLGKWDDLGRNVTFPCWTDPTGDSYDSAVVDTVANSRTGVTPEKFTQTSYTETLLSKTISIDIDRFLVNDMGEGILQHYADLVATKMQQAIQADLIAKAVAGTTLEHERLVETNNVDLTVEDILNARMKWGEHSNGAVPALFLHSVQYNKLAISEAFNVYASASKSAVVGYDPQNPGPVAVVHGVPLYLCDSVPVDTGVYTALMLMPGALGLWLKDVTTVDPIVHPGSAVVTLDTHFRWVSTLFRNNPRGCVKVIST